MWVRSLGWEDPLEEEIVTHSNILAWKTPWTEEPGGLQSMSHKVSDTTERLTLTVNIETSQIKNLPANAGDIRDAGFNPWVGKIPWRMAWQPILVPLPGESHGQRSLVSYGPQGHKELETTEVT